MNIHITEIGTGTVQRNAAGYIMTLPATSAERYHDAQIATYTGTKDFRHRPPLRLTLRAYVQGELPHTVGLHGTAGFGFWNHPFVPGERGFRLPKAAWFFFGSPPSDMALAKGVPGFGWKAATFDATRPLFLSLLPAAPLGFLLMRIPALYNRLWPVGQRAIGVSEHLLETTLLYQPHDYQLEWLPDRVIFAVDGVIVHESPYSPKGNLGFVAWIDNQYAVVTPQGRFRFGLIDVPQEQTLILENLRIDENFHNLPG